MSLFKRKNNKDKILDESISDIESSTEKNLESNPTDLDENFTIIEAPIFVPSNLVIGYYEGMTAKGLKDYINGYVHKYFDAPNTTYYRMMKYNSGYIFEIHDGDFKLSYLKKITEEFNDGKKEIFIKLQHRVAKIQKNNNKVDTYLLPESDGAIIREFLSPEKNKMKSIIPSGFGIVSFGIAIAFMGVTSLFLSSIFKSILGKEVKSELPTFNIESLPSTFIEKLPVATDTKYVTKVWLDGSNWKKDEKSIKTPEMLLRENNDRALSKIINYQNFTAKCFTKTGLFEQCNDDNIFFDKEDFSNDINIKTVSMKHGLIDVDFKDGEFINYVPKNQNGNLIWSIECSSSKISTICMDNTSIIIGDKVGDKEIVIESKTEDKKNPEVKNEVKDINSIISSPINIPETNTKKEKTINIDVNTIKIENTKKDELIDQKQEIKPTILKSPEEINKMLPETLNFDNLPENVIVE